MPAYCAKCGQQLVPGESKCVYCGQVISAAPQSGINIEGQGHTIGGDVVGRDKITSNTTIYGDQIQGDKVQGDKVEGDKIVQNILNYFAGDHAHEDPPAQRSRLRRELTTRIGQQQHLVALSAAWQRTITTGHGRAVFLTGPAGYGRKATAREFMAAPPTEAIVLTLPFFPVEGLQPDEVATLWRSDPRQQAALSRCAAEVARRFPYAVKIAGASWLVLVAQLIDQCPSLLDGPRPPLTDKPETLTHLLRIAAETRPILLSVEDLDLAPDSWWIDLLKSMLEESAHDWPLLLIASVMTPRPIAQIEKDDLHEALWLIKDLCEVNLAEARFFEAVTPAEVATYLGPAQPGLAERLCQLAAGHPLVIDTLWQEWQRKGAVVLRQGRWQTAQPSEQHWVWGDLKDLAEARLADCLTDDSAFDFDAAQTLLHVAALEGETFTAEAVAQVLDHDVDDVIDLFDDALLETADTPGVLVDMGFQCVERNGTDLELHRYAFVQPYLHQVWEKYMTTTQRQTWSLHLARTLENVWWPNPRRIARTLTRLYTAGGDKAKANEYQRAVDFDSELETLEWHTQFLAAQATDDRFELIRLCQLQLALGKKCLDRVHWIRALHAYETAEATATKTGIRRDLGMALYGQGFAYHNGGVLDKALDFYQQSLAIDRELGDRQGEGSALNNLGGVYDALGQKDKALDYCAQALVILREVGDRSGEGTTLNNLGGVYDDLGQKDKALEYMEQALVIHREVGDRSSEGTTLGNIGMVYHSPHDLGQQDRALDFFQQALAIKREVGDRAGEGTVLANIGCAYNVRGQTLEALDTYQQSLTITREVGNRWGESHKLFKIGLILDEMGRTAEAVTYLEQSAALREELGHPDLEAVRTALERVRAKLQGNE